MDIFKIGKNPNYLGSWDLVELPKQEITLTIKRISEEKVVTATQQEACAVCHWKEPVLPMILNPTNKKTLVKLLKTKETDKMVGKRVTVRVEKVKAKGEFVDALRIKNELPPAKQDESTYAKCELCGSPITPRAGMTSQELAAYTKEKYGSALCSKCATQAAKDAKQIEAVKEILNEKEAAEEAKTE